MENDDYENGDDEFNEEDHTGDAILNRDACFRRGAAHGVAGARKFIDAAMRQGQTADQFLADYEGVLQDWREGRTARNGYPDNPWTWSYEAFSAYVDEYKPGW